MDDADRQKELARLQEQLAEARARKAALIEEMMHLTARLPEIRRAFGNPFFYSHPEEPDEGVANYTGTRSGEVFTPTILEKQRVERELAQLKEQLRNLGVDPKMVGQQKKS
jgi:hypothetical protein